MSLKLWKTYNRYKLNQNIGESLMGKIFKPFLCSLNPWSMHTVEESIDTNNDHQ